MSDIDCDCGDDCDCCCDCDDCGDLCEGCSGDCGSGAGKDCCQCCKDLCSWTRECCIWSDLVTDCCDACCCCDTNEDKIKRTEQRHAGVTYTEYGSELEPITEQPTYVLNRSPSLNITKSGEDYFGTSTYGSCYETKNVNDHHSDSPSHHEANDNCCSHADTGGDSGYHCGGNSDGGDCDGDSGGGDCGGTSD